MIKNKKINIIGVCSDKGASRIGSDKGPNAIRLAGLFDAINVLGYDVCDCGDIYLENNITSVKNDTDNAIINPKLNNLAEVKEINRQLSQKTCECLKNGGFPLTLGGDHSITAGSAYVVLKHYGKIGIIWTDAHGDFNNTESSPSGNIHGMPLSALCGLGPNEILPSLDNSAFGAKDCENKNVPFIDPKNAVLFGVRDLDDAEKVRLKNSGVTVITPEEIDRTGIQAATAKAIQIAGQNTNGIYLSFDLDGLDPSVAPGVGTPAEGGLTYREARFLCEQVFKSGNLLAADMVELNPLLDCQSRTAAVAIELICYMLGKTLY